MSRILLILALVAAVWGEPVQSNRPAAPSHKVIHVSRTPPEVSSATIIVSVDTVPEAEELKAVVCAVARTESIEKYSASWINVYVGLTTWMGVEIDFIDGRRTPIELEQSSRFVAYYAFNRKLVRPRELFLHRDSSGKLLDVGVAVSFDHERDCSGRQ